MQKWKKNDANAGKRHYEIKTMKFKDNQVKS